MEKMTVAPQGEGLRSLLNAPQTQKRLEEILGKRASTFTASVLQIARQSAMLAEAEPNSIVGAAMTAATLDLPLNNSLGFAYIIPYKSKQKDGSWTTMAQFQIGYKGFIQLALRTGQFTRINCTDVKEGEITFYDRLSGDIDFNWISDDKERLNKKTIGYVAYFRLTNGFEAFHFMTIEQLNIHAKKYSQTFKGGFGIWKDDFDSMAQKTVLKLLLSKKAPLSVDMQKAVSTDQASFKDIENTEDLVYVDNEVVEIDPEMERLKEYIDGMKTQDDVDVISGSIPDELYVEYEKKIKALKLKMPNE